MISLTHMNKILFGILALVFVASIPAHAADVGAGAGDGISVVKESDLLAVQTAFLAIPANERPAALLAAAGLTNKKFSEWISARALKDPIDKTTATFIMSKTMAQMSEMARRLEMPMVMNCHANEAAILERASKGEVMKEPVCRKDAYAGIDKQLIALSKSGRLSELLPTINNWVITVIFYNVGVAHRAGHKI